MKSNLFLHLVDLSQPRPLNQRKSQHLSTAAEFTNCLQSSVIQELLKCSEEATDEVGQYYIMNTFDLGGCMKALLQGWNSSDLQMTHPHDQSLPNCLGVLIGQPYAEILTEADLVTGGSPSAVLKGKTYAKGFFCTKVVSEAIERLLIVPTQQQ